MHYPSVIKQSNRRGRKVMIPGLEKRKAPRHNRTRVVRSCPAVQHSCTLSFSSLAWKLNSPSISLSIWARVERNSLFISCWNIYSQKESDSKQGKHFHIFQNTVRWKSLESTFWCGQEGLFGLGFGGLNEIRSLLWYLAQRKDSINTSFIIVTIIIFLTPNLLVEEIMPSPL